MNLSHLNEPVFLIFVSATSKHGLCSASSSTWRSSYSTGLPSLTILSAKCFQPEAKLYHGTHSQRLFIPQLKNGHQLWCPIIIQSLTAQNDRTTSSQSQANHPVRLSQQVTFPANTAQIVMESPAASRLLTVGPCNLPSKLQSTIAARAIAEVLHEQTFHIIDGSFLKRLAHSQKHTVIAYSDKSRASISSSRGRTRKTPPKETSEEQCKPRSQSHTYDTVSVLHYNPDVNRATQKARHTNV